MTDHTHEVDSPNVSIAVKAICGRSAAVLKLLGHTGHPPNIVTSVSSVVIMEAAALW
jgi:hypothetical protein